ncbi:MAG: DUF349 domain-containing protein [Flavobacteriaceae bacterium]|nr:DUF349 domain-containing protein [Bacteroidia bacterium]NNF75782.1 DUF349 domain-containing protein [Flavobacteriaceae bacterium]NNK74023.1 DUF349 domain-containing protein [Flavobacteriaceae bacterium]
MSEKENLQEADGIKENEVADIQEPKPELESEKEDAKIDSPKSKETDDSTEESGDNTEESEDNTEESVDSTKESGDSTEESDEILTEIESTNAKEAEKDSKANEVTEEKDYSTLSMADLVDEMETLLKSDKIHTLKHTIEQIKSAFNKQFGTLLESKKAEFLEAGGNSIDFRFDFPLKSKFNALFKSYREQRQTHYKNLQKSFKLNLENRLEIIEEIKGLLNVEENINTTYKHFKALQERWRNAGPIPRDKYNNVWNNYHHHVENFYDFLHLNRDLRDLDFKHNLEKKTKIIERAEELAQDEDNNRAFRELQALHKMWKEELGPVAKEHREELWERFRTATKVIHEKRQAYYQELDKAYEKNLEKKHEIIEQILNLSEDESNNHSSWQKKINSVEDLRQQFFNAGKVPIKVNEATWSKFKEAVRAFNRKKNQFYKSLKKEQYENLNKKLELIGIAEANKDNPDFEKTTPLMKKIQSDWKAIGHVPRRDSDKIWNQFKGACNHYFNRLHERRNEDNKEENEAYDQKNELLGSLKGLTLSGDINTDIDLIKSKVDEWKALGKVPHNKRYVEGKFNKAINALYNKLDADKSKVELLKFESKLESIVQTEDKYQLDSERNYIRKRIDEISGEINQLENNLQFFSNVESDNPVVMEVHKKIDKQRDDLHVWEEKLKIIKKLY